jgi:hypothetical protein
MIPIFSSSKLDASSSSTLVYYFFLLLFSLTVAFLRRLRTLPIFNDIPHHEHQRVPNPFGSFFQYGVPNGPYLFYSSVLFSLCIVLNFFIVKKLF